MFVMIKLSASIGLLIWWCSIQNVSNFPGDYSCTDVSNVDKVCDENDKVRHFVYTPGKFVIDCYMRQMVPQGKMLVRDSKSGQLNTADCPTDWYQPHIYFSNETCGCEFLKSHCSGVGQIVVSEGTPSEDRTCRCDYREGYIPVGKQTNNCFFRPKKENITCILKQCATGLLLSPDNTCENNELYWKKQYQCPELRIRSYDIKPSVHSNYSCPTDEAVKTPVLGYVIASFCSLCFGIFITICMYERKRLIARIRESGKDVENQPLVEQQSKVHEVIFTRVKDLQNIKESGKDVENQPLVEQQSKEHEVIFTRVKDLQNIKESGNDVENQPLVEQQSKEHEVIFTRVKDLQNIKVEESGNGVENQPLVEQQSKEHEVIFTRVKDLQNIKEAVEERKNDNYGTRALKPRDETSLDRNLQHNGYFLNENYAGMLVLTTHREEDLTQRFYGDLEKHRDEMNPSLQVKINVYDISTEVLSHFRYIFILVTSTFQMTDLHKNNRFGDLKKRFLNEYLNIDRLVIVADSADVPAELLGLNRLHVPKPIEGQNEAYQEANEIYQNRIKYYLHNVHKSEQNHN